MPGDPSAALDDMIFVLWDFPEPTQTFIHREMEEMARRGARVQVLAARRLPVPEGASPELQRIASDAVYMGSHPLWLARGLAWAASHPRRFAEVTRWLTGLPHRTPWHRARAAGMVLAAASVVDELRRRKIRYVHAHFASYPSELTMALGRLLDVPIGMTGHAVGIWRDDNILAEKVEAAAIFLSCTEHNVQHMKSLAGAHADRVHRVYHGIDLSALPGPSDLPSGTPVRWLAIGRLVPKKGFAHLLDAVALLAARDVAVSLTILGDGPERPALEAKIAELGIGDRVDLPGAVASRDVWAHLDRSVGLVAPSVRAADGDMDGIPNVVLEAMCMARPVVASRVSGIPEVIEGRGTGVLVEPGDASGLADAMAAVSGDLEAAASMGRAGRALVAEYFSLARNVQSQLELIAAARGLPRPA